MQTAGAQHRRTLIITLAVAAVLGPELLSGPLRQPAAVAVASPLAQVYMPDSAAATERFQLARNLEKAGDWDRAAEIYQELLEKYPDKVVSLTGAGGDAAQYLSVPRLAQQLLCKWPANAIAIYRGKYGPAADTMLAAIDHDSPAALAALARRYFLTDAGTAASLQLLDRYWSAGRLVEAARWGRLLLDLHPSIEPHRPAILFQSAMALHLCHDDPHAQELLNELASRYPQALGQVAGRDIILATELAANLKTPVAAATRSLDSWPMFGGSPDRAGVPAASAHIDARLYSIDLHAGSEQMPTASGMPGGAMPPGMAMAGNLPGPAMLQAIRVMPAVDRGELFFSDGARIFGMSLGSGMKLPGWPAVSVSVARGSTQGGMRTVAVTDRSVLSVVGASALPWLLRGADDSSGLACLDRATGRVRWKFRPSQLPRLYASLRDIQLVPNVLVADGSVYVAAHGGKSGQIDDAYLLCLDETDGHCRWATYIASGPSMGAAFSEDSPFPLETIAPQFSLAAGRLIVSTNLGVIAALDIADGSVAWMTLYERPATQASTAWQFRRRVDLSSLSKGWIGSPPIITGDQAYVLPADGVAILTLNTETGAVSKTLPRKAVDGADILLAVDGGKMVLASDRSAWCIDANTLNATAANLTDATLWNMRFGNAALRGLPFLTNDALYIPTDQRIFVVSRAKWKVTEVYPQYAQPWPKTEGPGNIVVSADHVVVAAAGRINVYASMASASAKLDQAIAANPTSPEPLLRYAELLVAAGRDDAALARLWAAIPLAAADPIAAERAFNLALGAWKQLAGSTDAAHTAIAAKFFDAATAAARLPRHRAQLWIAGGDFASNHDQWQQAVDAFARVLADRDARDVLLTAPSGTSMPAWQRAFNSIQLAIGRKGRDLYTRYDQQAADALGKARAGNAQDAEAFIDIGRQFPNSTSAPAAMLQGARILEDHKQYKPAADLLRRMYQLQPSGELAPQAIEAMARVYCAIPDRSIVAASRLSLGAETLKNPRLAGEIRLPNGQVLRDVSFSDAAAAIRRQLRDHQRTPLPDFAFPVTSQGDALKQTYTIPAVQGLVEANPSAERDDRIVACTVAGELLVAEPGKPEPLLKLRVTNQPPQHYAWQGPILTVWNDTELAAVEPPQPAVRWKLSLDSLPGAPQPLVLNGTDDAAAPAPTAAPPVGDVEDSWNGAPGNVVPVALTPGAAGNDGQEPETLASCDGNSAQLVLASSSGRIAAVDAATGKLTWQTCLRGCIAQRVLCGEEFSAIQFSENSPLQLAAIDNATGQIVYRIARTGGPIQNFDLASDGRLIFTFPDRLCAKDLFEPGDALAFDTRIAQRTPFAGAVEPLQLQTTSDRILAVTDNGTRLRAFSLQTGRSLPIPARDVAPADSVTTLAHEPGTILLVDDPYAYLISDSTLAAYNLDRAEYPLRRLPLDAKHIRFIAVGQHHLLTFDEPEAPAAKPLRAPANGGDAPTQMRMLAYSRAQAKEGESGRLEHVYQFTESSGIGDVTAINGGIVYVTGSHELRFLAGTTSAATTRP